MERWLFLATENTEYTERFFTKREREKEFSFTKRKRGKEKNFYEPERKTT